MFERMRCVRASEVLLGDGRRALSMCMVLCVKEVRGGEFRMHWNAVECGLNGFWCIHCGQKMNYNKNTE